MIKIYDTFNNEVCPDELIVGDFNDKPIPSDCYNFLSNDNEYGNNVPGTPVDDALLYKEKVEDAVVPNYEDINDEIIIIDDDDRLASNIDPLQNEILVIEGAESET